MDTATNVHRELDAVLLGDPTRGREALRRLFDGERIKVTPQPGRTYVAESTLLPMMLFAPTYKRRRQPLAAGAAFYGDRLREGDGRAVYRGFTGIPRADCA